MDWKEPIAFSLIIAWFLSALYYYFLGRKKSGAFFVSSLKNFRFSKNWRARFSELPSVFLFAGLLLLILALARPQKPLGFTKKNVEGVDIMLVLDTSISMLIEDMSPGNRIESAKKVIRDFVGNLVYDRAGLIVFSGESYTQTPLTLDYQVLLSDLDQVVISHYDPHIKPGTAIGTALANTAARLKNSSAKSRVAVFLTDGEDNTGVISPETALDIIKQHNIKVYTIGVGSRSGRARVPLKIKDAGGRTRTMYQNIQSQINEKLLKKIAKETKGKYFKAGSMKALKVIFSEISQMEKTKLEVSQEIRYQEVFPAFLQWAALLYAFSFFLSLTVFWRMF